MSNKLFSNSEIEILKKNKYVKSVSNKSITYTTEFRELFYNQYEQGISANTIFKNCGFDIEMLGSDRVINAIYRFKAMHNRVQGFQDTRELYSGTLKRNPTDEEKILKLTKENIRLKQEMEFLKKMEFLAKQKK